MIKTGLKYTGTCELLACISGITTLVNGFLLIHLWRVQYYNKSSVIPANQANIVRLSYRIIIFKCSWKTISKFYLKPDLL